MTMEGPAGLYCFLAQKRSGHHATIAWLAAQLPGTVYQFNNPASFLDLFTPESFGRNRTEAKARPPGPFLTWTPFSLKELKAAFRDDTYLCANYETFAVRDEDEEAWKVHRAKLAQFGRKVQHVLVYRDPYNMIASRWVRNMKRYLEALETWKDYARVALGLLAAPAPMILINYTCWFHDAAYRNRLSAALGVVHSDAGLNYVPTIGHGSSFSALNFQNRAQKMPVSTRWRGPHKDPAFRKLFADADIAYYSRQLFHFDTGVMEAVAAMAA